MLDLRPFDSNNFLQEKKTKPCLIIWTLFRPTRVPVEAFGLGNGTHITSLESVKFITLSPQLHVIAVPHLPNSAAYVSS